MKGRFLVALFLYLAFAVVFSGCRTVDTVEGQTAHHVALQALTSGNCKIVLEEIYIPSDRPEKLRTQQVSGSYFVIRGGTNCGPTLRVKSTVRNYSPASLR